MVENVTMLQVFVSVDLVGMENSVKHPVQKEPMA